ncbi:hypothetical protein D3C85_1040890 [compost metagenome]
MNSLMSMRIRCSSESNRNSASARVSSVLPTPVGPRNRNDPYGRAGSARPARERRMASDTRRTASSWPTTRLCRNSSMCSSFSRSPCIIFDTGMPVARDTTSAISSAPTRVRNRRGRDSSPSAFSAASAAPTSAAFRRDSRSGSLPYCSSASLSNWPLRCNSAISARTLSISSLMAWVPCTAAFSAFQISS